MDSPRISPEEYAAALALVRKHEADNVDKYKAELRALLDEYRDDAVRISTHLMHNEDSESLTDDQLEFLRIFETVEKIAIYYPLLNIKKSE